MTQEEQAIVLAQWLTQPPGSAPPADLDPDVVEAIYALRPDLAPAPHVDLDALMSTVTTGPLAGSGPQRAPSLGDGGEVVPFPSRSLPAMEGARPGPAEVTAPQGRRGWGRWVTFAGGTSSLGLLVAAAAVLLFVALPASRELQPAEPEAAPSPAAADAPAASSPARPADETVESTRAAAEEAKVAGPPAEPLAARSERKVGGGEAAPMQREALYRSNTTIPEMQEDRVAGAPAPADDAPAVVGGVSAPSLDAVADAEQAPAAAEEQKAERSAPARPAKEDIGSDPRSAAVPRDLSANGWRRGLDRATEQVFDAALTEAQALSNAGDPRGAAERLARAVGAPARAGQHVAAKATAAWLSAGDPAGAESVARRGLALSSENTPERSQLLVALGDALAASGDPTAATEAWQQAAAANSAR